MITVSRYLSAVQGNIARVRRYKLGGDGTGGNCDCIGLIIGAVRLTGDKWPWIHGSNHTARYRVQALRRVDSAAELQLGALVFKAREPEDKGYALPSAYKGHADQRDYYHVGVVTCLSPLEIAHCTGVSGGIKRDSALGAWRYAGWLTLVNKEVDTMITYKTTAKMLAIRRGAGTSYDVVARIDNVGTRVAGGAPINGWVQVTYGDVTGYCMAEYLAAAGTEDNTQGMTAQEAMAALEQAVGALRSVLNI